MRNGRILGPAVGNDVVDTTHPRCAGKSADHRFLARILTPAEAETVRSASDPDRCLWLHWAAKEAAFKAATRVRGEPPVFEHAAFRVDLPEAGDAVEGSVRWEELVLPWREWQAPHAVGGIHVVCWAEGPDGPPDLHGGTEAIPDGDRIPRNRFTERERRAVHSPPSGWARLRARAHLAELAGVDEDVLEIVTADGPPGRVPPAVLMRGEPTGWSVSLSHHGRLVAWALARGGGRG